MNWASRLALYAMAAGMTAAGLVHFLNPGVYLAIVPQWLPFRVAIIYGSGVFELLGGIGLVLPHYRRGAALLVLMLMMMFLPVHAWDCFRAHPAMGSTGRAVVRFLLQFVLIGWAWSVLQQAQKTPVTQTNNE